MIEFLIFLLSLPALYYGARLLTDGARELARAAGISEFVIGATVVAFGTIHDRGQHSPGIHVS
jgi:cation:H+ antiporter